MTKYIEREALMDVICMENCNRAFEELCPNCYPVEKILEAPAADVVEVVHGRWEPCEPDSDVRFYCSKCETEISTSWDYDCDEMWNFCPNCGARMDGDG